MSAETIAERRFGQSWRGYDQEEVRQFLAEVAGQVQSLRERYDRTEAARREAEERAAHPHLDEATLMSALGEETAAILRSAHAAAAEVVAKAEDAAERSLGEAQAKAQDLLTRAESALAERTAEAEAAAARVLEQAEQQASAIAEEAARKHDELIQSAEAQRDKVLADLARRRKLATVQIEQLRAGRERLLGAYLTVRETLDEVTAELQRADAEARAASEAVSRQHAAELEALGVAPSEDVWTVQEQPKNAGGSAVVLAPKAVQLQRGEGQAASGPEPRGAGAARHQGEGNGRPNPGGPSAAVVAPSSGSEWGGEATGQHEAVVAPAAAFESVRIVRTGEVALPAEPPAPEVAGDEGVARPEEPLTEEPLTEEPLTEEPLTEEPVDLAQETATGTAAEPVTETEPGLASGVVAEPAPAGAEAEAAEATVDLVGASPAEPPGGEPAAEGTDPGPGAPTGATPPDAGAPDAGAPDAGAPDAGAPDAGAASGAATSPDVESLFARIRAGRAEATSKARKTLETSGERTMPEPLTRSEAAEEAPAAPTADDREDPGTQAAGTSLPAEEPVTSPHGVPATLDEDLDASAAAEREFFARRDEVTTRLETSLARKLKRALQDEQNALLDRLRNLKGPLGPANVLPSAEEHPDRFIEVGRPLLEEAARGGAALATNLYGAAAKGGAAKGGAAKGGAAKGTDLGPEVVDDLAEELGRAIAEPLRQRLEEALRSSGSEAADIADALGSAYREWKTQRIEAAAHDEVAAAFSRGAYQALPERALLRWVVDDREGPCPDCEDNTLARDQRKGEPWPTGQLYPPAHPGCRCALAPEGPEAAAKGTGAGVQQPSPVP
jgi:DivIVA domain-containing protein